MGDCRPIYDPSKGERPPPWWCTGWGEDYSIVCAIVEGVDQDAAEERLLALWPEASHIDATEHDLDFYPKSDRFPAPTWTTDPPYRRDTDGTSVAEGSE